MRRTQVVTRSRLRIAAPRSGVCQFDSTSRLASRKDQRPLIRVQRAAQSGHILGLGVDAGATSPRVAARKARKPRLESKGGIYQVGDPRQLPGVQFPVAEKHQVQHGSDRARRNERRTRAAAMNLNFAFITRWRLWRRAPASGSFEGTAESATNRNGPRICAVSNARNRGGSSASAPSLPEPRRKRRVAPKLPGEQMIAIGERMTGVRIE